VKASLKAKAGRMRAAAALRERTMASELEEVWKLAPMRKKRWM